MGLHYNPEGKKPVFLVANLKKYSLNFTGLGCDWKGERKIWVKITLTDADKDEFTLYRAKVEAQIAAIEERLGVKLDTQHGILVALIDRVRSLDNEIIRQEVMMKTILGVPQLIETSKIAKAKRSDKRKD